MVLGHNSFVHLTFRAYMMEFRRRASLGGLGSPPFLPVLAYPARKKSQYSFMAVFAVRVTRGVFWVQVGEWVKHEERLVAAPGGRYPWRRVSDMVKSGYGWGWYLFPCRRTVDKAFVTAAFEFFGCPRTSKRYVFRTKVPAGVSGGLTIRTIKKYVRHFRRLSIHLTRGWTPKMAYLSRKLQQDIRIAMIYEKRDDQDPYCAFSGWFKIPQWWETWASLLPDHRERPSPPL